MRKKNWLKLFSFFLIMVLIANCGGAGDNATIQTTPVIIPATTKVLDSSSANNILEISQNGAQITFSGTTPQIDALEVGDIIICEPSSSAPSGLLRKITSIDIIGNQIIVTTADVPIEEAIQKGSWSITQSLSSTQVVKAVSVAKGVTLSKSASLGKFNVSIDNVILYDDDGNTSTTNDQILASGNIEIEPSYTFSGDIDNFKLKNLIFTNTTTETCSITLSANVSLVDFDKSIEIAKYSMPTVTIWVGSVPIVIMPILTVYVGVSGNISVGISTGIVQQASFTNGLNYASSSGWSIIKDYSMNFTFTPPILTAAATAKCYAGLELELLVYGAAGPNASANIYMELNANPLNNPWWQLYGGIEANAGVELEIFSHVVASYSANIFDYQVLIAEADGGCTTSCSDTSSATLKTYANGDFDRITSPYPLVIERVPSGTLPYFLAIEVSSGTPKLYGCMTYKDLGEVPLSSVNASNIPTSGYSPCAPGPTPTEIGHSYAMTNSGGDVKVVYVESITGLNPVFSVGVSFFYCPWIIIPIL